MKIVDSSGHLRFLLSFFVLFVNHGLRDYLITGLPAIASKNTTTSGIFLNGEIHKVINIFKFLSNSNDRSLNFTSSEFHYVLNKEVGWTDAMVGVTLSSLYWGWLVALIAAPFIITRISLKPLLACSLFASGILALFTELAGNRTVSGIPIIRTAQGALQGWCYPIVYYILEDTTQSTFALPYFLIFLGPWLGSSFGVLLGWANNPYSGAYAFGVLSILVGFLSLIIPLHVTNSSTKPKEAWWECLRSAAVWACILLQFGMAWALHLFIVGLSFTLYFKLHRDDLMWTVFLVILVGGVVNRTVAMAAMSLLRTHCLSPLNRRRAIVLFGSTVIIICLLTIGASGINSPYLLCGLNLFGVCVGAAFCLVGVRLNLHDLGPLFPTPFLILASIGATVGAGMSSLLFPLMAQIENINTTSIQDIENGPWRLAWMVPTVIVVAVCSIHLVFISVIPLPHQTLINPCKEFTETQTNGGMQLKEEMDAKSFKSIKSALSFKSAVSRQRTRTVSFKTVDDNIEADLQTVPDSDIDEWMSVDDDDNQEMKSVKSGVSFKTATEARTNSISARDLGVVLNAQELDRTSAWLSAHHTNTGIQLDRQSSIEKDKIERNILFALQW